MTRPSSRPRRAPGCAQIARKLDRERPDRALHAEAVAAELRVALADADLNSEVLTRLKSPCSARAKMLRKGVPLAGLHDVCGVRVLVDSVADCYAALETAYTLWAHVPAAFDDYIKSPKDNGYQSLHAVLQLPCGHTIELQIRTHDQHRYAECGPAAHWRYKQDPS